MAAPNGPNVWVVRYRTSFAIRLEGVQFYVVRGVSQRVAVTIARLIAKANQSELIVHDRLGRIRAKDSHGSDSPYRRG